MKEKSCQKKQQHQETIAEFYRDNPIAIDEERYKQFVLKFEAGASEKGVLDSSIFHLFDNNADTLAQYAAHSFLNNQITQQQLTTLLLIRTLFKEHAYQCIDILDNEGELTPEASEHLFHFIPLEKKESFLNLLKFQPCSEACFLKVTLEINDKTDIRLRQFLELLAKDKVIKIAGKNDTHLTIIMSATGARDAILTCIYGEHAKKSYPIAGKISIETMNSYMQKGIRLINVSYPDIADIIKFHDIAASSLYVSLHDEFHRTLISSIPNAVYAALLYTQQVVKETTGIQWSKELWESLDMEVGNFLNRIPSAAEPANVTTDFLTTISSSIYTEARPNGLFHASLFNDTMWLLLIHIHFNLDLWKALLIEPSFFAGNYKIFYDFIGQNSDALKGINPAQQIALIKSKWLKSPINLDNLTFIKEGKYIQITDNPQMISKEVLLKDFDAFNLFSDFNEWRWKDYNKLVELAAQHEKLLFHAAIISKNVLGLVARENLVSEIIRIFPSHRQVLYEAIISSPEALEQLASSAAAVRGLVTTFPEYGQALFDTLFSSPEIFKRLTSDYSSVVQISYAFPEQNQVLFDIICSSPEAFKRLATNAHSLNFLVSVFPDHRQTLFDVRFSFPDAFDDLATNAQDVSFLVCAFPEHKPFLFAGIFPSPEAFKRLASDAYDVEYFANAFPEHRNRLFEALFSSPDDFKRFARIGCDAETLVRAFPEHQQTLFEGIFSSPEDIKRLACNAIQQKALMRAFPQYDFLALDGCQFPLTDCKGSFFARPTAEIRTTTEIKPATDNLNFGKQ